MKLISHRGNIDGENLGYENNPNYIESAIKKGYDVEVDVRYDSSTEKVWLGHDFPQYEVDISWITNLKNYLWIHCKDLNSLYFFSKINELNYFWHQTDDFTLTSKKYIWTYPGKSYSPFSVIVTPEKYIGIDNLIDLKKNNCYGICSDYVSLI